MNKNDWILCIIIAFLCCFGIYQMINKKEATIAIVYHKNNQVLTIPLTEERKQYEVMGTNGIVKIEVAHQKIRVVEETSQKHLCSKQGAVGKETASIICLPNEIVIQLKSEDTVDTIVR